MFVSSLLLLPVTLGDGEKALEFQDSYRRSGKRVSTPDCLIAATALNNDAAVLTSDKDFERIQHVEKIVLG